MTLYLLKVHLQMFLSIPITQKCQILSCDALVANKQYGLLVTTRQREERRLRVFENRVLMRVSEPKRDEVTGELRKLHNYKLSDLYSLPNIVQVVKSRRMRWAGHVACVGEGRGVHRVVVGKPEGRRPLGRPRRS